MIANLIGHLAILVLNRTFRPAVLPTDHRNAADKLINPMQRSKQLKRRRQLWDSSPIARHDG
jgi:hypothetical protein